VPLLAIASFGIFLSVLTKNSAAAIVVTLVYELTMEAVVGLVHVSWLRHYLLSAQFDAWHGFFQTPLYWTPIVRALWVSALFIAVPLTAAFVLFRRRARHRWSSPVGRAPCWLIRTFPVCVGSCCGVPLMVRVRFQGAPIRAHRLVPPQSERASLLECALEQQLALLAAASEQKPAVPVGGAEDDPDDACRARASRGVAMGG